MHQYQYKTRYLNEQNQKLKIIQADSEYKRQTLLFLFQQSQTIYMEIKIKENLASQRPLKGSHDQKWQGKAVQQKKIDGNIFKQSNRYKDSHNLSHELFLKLLKYIGIIYISISIASIPFWVFTYFSFIEYKQFKSLEGQEVSSLNYFLISTSLYITWVSNYPSSNLTIGQTETQMGISMQEINRLLQKSKIQIRANDFMDISYFSKMFKQPDEDQFSTKQYKDFMIYYDIFLQSIIFCALSMIQYKTFKQKQSQKGYHIQDYSLRIQNFPLGDLYINMPKFQQFLISQIRQKFDLIDMDIALYDMTSIWGEKMYKLTQIEQELKVRTNQKQYEEIQNDQRESAIKTNSYRINNLKKLRDLVQINKNRKTDVIIVTFVSRQARYLALRFLQTTDKKFMDKKLNVEKAPNPLQIFWQNQQVSQTKLFLSQNFSFIICMVLLLTFDLLILYIHKSQVQLLAVFIILIIEIVLKQIILQISNKQIHLYKSQYSLSIFSKLTKYLYINSGLIIFISSFDLGDNMVGQIFSTRQYDNLQQRAEKWYRDVGFLIMTSFILQVFFNIIRPGLEVIKQKIKKKVTSFVTKQVISLDKKQSSQQEIPEQSICKQRLKSELDICYAHITSLIMYANTYTFTHPIFYLIVPIFTILAYFSHRHYIQKYAQPAPYNNDQLNISAIQYLYGSIGIHFFVMYLGYKSKVGLVLSITIIVGLLIKNTLLRLILQIVRKRCGPFCFSNVIKNIQKKSKLTELLNISQLTSQIDNMKHKILMYTYFYNSRQQRDIEKNQFPEKINECKKKHFLHLQINRLDTKIKQLQQRIVCLTFLQIKDINPQQQYQLKQRSETKSQQANKENTINKFNEYNHLKILKGVANYRPYDQVLLL